MAQFFLSGKKSFLVCRALLGFMQGGFIPDLILYLSCASRISVFNSPILMTLTDFYTKHELPFRLALFWLSSDACSVFGSFLAVGVLKMRGLHGRAGWRWLFLIE